MIADRLPQVAAHVVRAMTHEEVPEVARVS